jgi:hypothetical protein
MNKNNLLAGILIGLVLPTVTFAIMYQLFELLEMQGAASGEGLSANFRERTLVIIAISVNLIPLNIYKRKRWDLSIRGLVIATSLLALAWVGRYGLSLF